MPHKHVQVLKKLLKEIKKPLYQRQDECGGVNQTAKFPADKLGHNRGLLIQSGGEM